LETHAMIFARHNAVRYQEHGLQMSGYSSVEIVTSWNEIYCRTEY